MPHSPEGPVVVCLGLPVFQHERYVERLRALNRRQRGTKNPTLEIEGVTIDTVSRQVVFAGRAIGLTPHEYRLLEFLARRRGRVYSHDQLIEQLYAAGSYVTRNAVEAHISALRKRLQAVNAPKLIKTRRGFGYLIE